MYFRVFVFGKGLSVSQGVLAQLCVASVFSLSLCAVDPWEEDDVKETSEF